MTRVELIDPLGGHPGSHMVVKLAKGATVLLQENGSVLKIIVER